MKNKDKLIKKIVEIMADYKFNLTQISTAEQTAERIINIIKQEQEEPESHSEMQLREMMERKFPELKEGEQK